MILLTDSISGRGILLNKTAIVCIEDVGAYRLVTYLIGKENSSVAVKEEIDAIAANM
jgi:hypothetical protein